jgi:hypothetical protein
MSLLEYTSKGCSKKVFSEILRRGLAIDVDNLFKYLIVVYNGLLPMAECKPESERSEYVNNNMLESIKFYADKLSLDTESLYNLFYDYFEWVSNPEILVPKWISV